MNHGITIYQNFPCSRKAWYRRISKEEGLKEGSREGSGNGEKPPAEIPATDRHPREKHLAMEQQCSTHHLLSGIMIHVLESGDFLDDKVFCGRSKKHKTFGGAATSNSVVLITL